MHLPSLDYRSSSIVKKKFHMSNDQDKETSIIYPVSETKEKTKINHIIQASGFASNFEKYENIESHWRFSNSTLDLKKSKEHFK